MSDLGTVRLGYRQLHNFATRHVISRTVKYEDIDKGGVVNTKQI